MGILGDEDRHLIINRVSDEKKFLALFQNKEKSKISPKSGSLHRLFG